MNQLSKEQTMKTIKLVLLMVITGGLGFGAALLWMNHQPSTSRGGDAEVPPAVAADETVTQPRLPVVAEGSPKIAAEPVTPQVKRSPQELLDELFTIQVAPGPGQARAQYRIMSLLDQLAQAGSSALLAIRQFLDSNRDVAYAEAGGNNGRNGSRNALLPPSLRFGVFDVVRQIGGPDAEQVLADSLTNTGRGAELAYLSQLLEGASPGKYRDVALLAARSLLASGKISDPAERNQLYDVMRQFKDTSYVSTAQAQLVQGDGKVDRSALRYLQQSLGEQSLALAVQTYKDGRVVDSDSREALGRVALNFVGANDQALELFHQAALDPQIKPDQRRNLIEDLNQDGFTNRKNPTPEDLKLMANRYALTQSYLQQDYVRNDKMLTAAFQEANKDLGNMLQRAGAITIK
jgi:hypothetical protein